MKCIAWVIGINNYDNYSVLRNPVNDAVAIAGVFQKLKYDVRLSTDITYKEFTSSRDIFLNKLFDDKYDVAVVYVAGHGNHINNKNCCILKDTPKFNPIGLDVLGNSLVVEDLLNLMKDFGDQLNIIIVDSCRTNPNEVYRGYCSANGAVMKPIELPYQSFLAFSTSIGATASDGRRNEDHSLYAQALLNHISELNLPIELLFKKVRYEVRLKNESQVPWEYTCLINDFSFNYGQLDPYYGKLYSKTSYVRAKFISQNPLVNTIIKDFQNFSYTTQHIALGIFKSNLRELTDKNDLFVIGRYIFRSAVSGAYNCMEELNVTNLKKYDTSEGNHVLNGILYELYFDSNNNLRNKLLGAFLLNRIILLFTNRDFGDSIKFLDESLSGYKENILYVVGDDTVLRTYITITEDETMKVSQSVKWKITDIKVREEIVTNRIDNTKRTFDVNTLRDFLQEQLGIPSSRMKIVFSETISNGDAFQFA